MNTLKKILVILVILSSILLRLGYFNDTGKDIDTYKKAVVDLLDGKNPYKYTIRTYVGDDNDPWNHGFAYLPGLLYVNAPLYLLHLKTNISLEILWKIPVLIADVIIGFYIFKKLSKNSYYMGLFGMVIWLFNPYLVTQNNYTYSDPLAILFVLLALHYTDKDDVLSGMFFAISIAFKTFSIILLPLLFFKSLHKIKFILSGLIIGVLISIPFLRSLNDFVAYINGSLLVHGSRVMQGRPFLFYISYLVNIETIQIIPIKVYTYLAMGFSMIIPALLLFLTKIRKKYILSLISFILFYAFTPVLNRTYLLWFLPILIVGMYRLFKNKQYCFYITMLVFYGFYYWYLDQWIDGFHITAKL